MASGTARRHPRGVRYCGGGPNGPGSAIYSKYGNAAQTYEIQGSIFSKYVCLGQTSELGFPVSDQNDIVVNGNLLGWASYFEGQHCGQGGPYNSGSAIYSRKSNSAQTHKVHSCIYNILVVGIRCGDVFSAGCVCGVHRGRADAARVLRADE